MILGIGIGVALTLLVEASGIGWLIYRVVRRDLRW
jgi:hypothetical protein